MFCARIDCECLILLSLLLSPCRKTAMHSDCSNGSRSKGSSSAEASIGKAMASRRKASVSGSAVETTCSHFGSATLVIAAEGQRAGSGNGSGIIPMPPPSWGMGREEQRPAPKDKLSANADMAYGAGTSIDVTKPSERGVMRGSLHPREGPFAGPTHRSSPTASVFRSGR